MTEVYVVSPTYRVGEAVPTTPESISASAAATDELRREGFTSYRRADAPTWQMAAWATHPVLERLSAAGLDPARYVYSTEKVFGEHSASVLARYLAAIGEEAAPCLMVGGYSCADFVAGLEVAEMMCARGGSPVVLVTTDALEAGRSRVYRDLAVVSDGAAACALTSQPVGPSFQVLATALRNSATIDGTGSSLTDLRASGRQVRAVTDQALAEAAIRRADVGYVVVDNLRAGSQQFTAMAAGFRDPTRVVSADASFGHCHAADPLIALAQLRDRGALRDGDHVLVVATGGRSWTAAALRYVAA